MDLIDEWIKDHCWAPDDIILGGRGLLTHQCEALWELLDIVRPGWRDLFDEEGKP